MAERITVTNLRRLVERLNKMTGSPETAFTKDAAGKFHANLGHYSIDGAYGGYALQQITTDGGGVRQVLHRGSARDLYERIHAYMDGLDQCIGDTFRDNPKRKTKKKSRSHFTHEHITSPRRMAKGSIRTKTVQGKRGKVKAEIRVGCPKGKYNKKSHRCRVGMKTVSVLRPNPKPKTFRVILKKQSSISYLTPEKLFDTDYRKSERFYKETALNEAKRFSKNYPYLTFGVSDGKA
jgi:hypothetical protein